MARPKNSASEAVTSPEQDATLVAVLTEDPPSAEPEPTDAADATRSDDAAEVRTCPHGASPEGCPLCALDAGVAPAEPAPSEPEPVVDDEPDEPEALDDEAWAEALAAAPSEADLPLDEGEEITAERLGEDGDLVVVTSFGRKIGISPDGWIAVLTGPDIAVSMPPAPKPPRSSWKDPR